MHARPIEGCVDWELRCPMLANGLLMVDADTMYCRQCDRDVHLVSTQLELEMHAAQRNCVAFVETRRVPIVLDDARFVVLRVAIECDESRVNVMPFLRAFHRHIVEHMSAVPHRGAYHLRHRNTRVTLHLPPLDDDIDIDIDSSSSSSSAAAASSSSSTPTKTNMFHRGRLLDNNIVLHCFEARDRSTLDDALRRAQELAAVDSFACRALIGVNSNERPLLFTRTRNGVPDADAQKAVAELGHIVRCYASHPAQPVNEILDMLIIASMPQAKIQGGCCRVI
jgi:hypothetical protein